MGSVLMVGVVVFVLVFGLYMLAYFVGASVGKERARHAGVAFQNYLVQHFPDLSAPSEMLCASKQSKDNKVDIALLVAEQRREIILLFDGGRGGISHLACPFSALTRVDSTSQIISRGVPPSRVYSYEQAMTLSFADGRAVALYLEMPSNMHGTDKAPGIVAALFAPWEEKLNGILHDVARERVEPVGSAAQSRRGEQSVPVPGVAAAPTASGPSQPSAPAPVAAWYPDPSRRHQVRYWDGQDWTANVGDQGAQSTDPVKTSYSR